MARLQQRVFDLESQLERSQQRVTALENTPESQIPSSPTLQQQMTAILDARHQVYHIMVPITWKTFSFSIESVISELQKHAPDVFQLMQQLGKTSGHESKDHMVQDLQSLTAIIALLKSGSSLRCAAFVDLHLDSESYK